jgi:hypothetical protein
MKKKDVYDAVLSSMAAGRADLGERGGLFHILVSMISILFPFNDDSVRLTARSRNTGAGRLAASLRGRLPQGAFPLCRGSGDNLPEGRTFGPKRNF